MLLSLTENLPTSPQATNNDQSPRRFSPRPSRSTDLVDVTEKNDLEKVTFFSSHVTRTDCSRRCIED